jgi:aryl-alcohol dehydrogenase-like predicted oxidoreductase
MYNDLKKIIIGTANLENNYGFSKNKLVINEFKKILKFAKKNKINSIDVAPEYKNVFNTLNEINLKNWNVYSKVSNIPEDINLIEDYILNSVSENLKRIKIKNFKGLMIHWPWDLKRSNYKIINKSLKKLKKYKLSSEVGISLYSNYLKKNYLNLIDLDFIQCPFNLVDQSLKEKNMIKFFQRKKIKIIVRSIFFQGILLNSSLKKFNILKKYPVFLKKLEDFKKKQENLLKLNLNFIFSHKFFTNSVIGFDNSNQFVEINEIIEKFKYKNIVKIEELKSFNKKIINPYEW